LTLVAPRRTGILIEVGRAHPVTLSPVAVTRMKDSLESDRCARMLRALGDPERLRIIQCLRDGPRNVGEVAALLDDTLVKVSHHLGVLRNAGLVRDTKAGRHVLYELHPDVFRPTSRAGADFLDLGCCRLEIPKGSTAAD
jgi:ArsR family transcriptional regulator